MMSAPAQPPRSSARGQARRLAILQTASLQFAERGFHRATILDIAAACGISRAGLLHHFPDKESLLMAVLEQRDREDRERFGPYTTSQTWGIGALRGMVDLAERNRLAPGLIALFVRLSAEASDDEHPAHAYFNERYLRVREETAAALRSAAAAGYVASGLDPEATAVELIAIMDGLQGQWLFDRDVDMAAYLRRALNRVLSAEGRVAFASGPT